MAKQKSPARVAPTLAELRRVSRNPDIRAVLVLHKLGEFGSQKRSELIARFGADVTTDEEVTMQEMLLADMRALIAPAKKAA